MGCLGPVGVPFLAIDQATGESNVPFGQDVSQTLGCMTSHSTKGCGFAMHLEAAYPISVTRYEGPELCGGSASCASMNHSCAPSGSLFANPSVRLNHVVHSLAHGTQISACEIDQKPFLSQIADDLNALVDLHCLVDAIPDADRPDCNVSDDFGGTNTMVAACSATSGVPCWRLAPSERCIRHCNAVEGRYQRLSVVIDRGGGEAPSGTTTHVSCARAPTIEDPIVTCEGSP